MSYSIDVNILLYASDAASQFHEKSVEFLDKCAQDKELLYITWPTLISYLRISTHPGIFSRPLSPEDAKHNIQNLLSLPQVKMISEQDDFWKVFEEVMNQSVIRGNLVSDAHIAAILKQQGIKTFFTNDSDFRKFPFLEIRSPF